MYVLNGKIHFLDKWLIENLHSLHRFAMRCHQEFNILPPLDYWLNINSTRDFEKLGFKMHFPPLAQVKTVPPPPGFAQVLPQAKSQPIASSIPVPPTRNAKIETDGNVHRVPPIQVSTMGSPKPCNIVPTINHTQVPFNQDIKVSPVDNFDLN